MTDSIVWRLVWKEYRVLRGFWLCLAAFGVVLMPLSLFADEAPNRFAVLAGVVRLLPAFYVLGCSAVAFAAEREDGTDQMLYRLGTPRGRLWFGKLGFDVVSTLLLFGVLWLAAEAFVFSTLVGERPTGVIQFPFHPVMAWLLGFLTWGMLFSLLCRSVLSALCWAVVASLATPYVVDMAISQLSPAFYSIMSPRAWDSMFHTSDAIDWMTRLVVLPVVLLIESYRLTHLWANDRGYRLPGWITWPWRTVWQRIRNATSHWRVTPKIVVADAATPRVRPLTRESAPPWRRELKRLVWLEWRTARWVTGITLAIVLGLSILAQSRESYGKGSGQLIVIMVALSPALFGLWSASGEQRGKQFRCLTDQGLSPHQVWSIKHGVWFSATLVTVVVSLGIAEMANLKNVPGNVAGTNRPHPVIILLFASLSYAVGQFFSILIPRAITATFLGLVAGGAMLAWSVTMTNLHIPFEWSVLPLLPTLLLATWLFSTDWMFERRSWRAWLKPLGVCAAAGTLVVTYTIWYRVTEIPTTPRIVELTTRPELSISAEATETGKLLRQAAQSLGNWSEEPKPGHKREVFRFPPHHHTNAEWQPIDPNSKRWVDENQRVLSETIELASRADCAFGETYLVDSHTGVVANIIADIARLGYLLRTSAWQLETEDRLDEAFERHLLNLRLASLCGRHAGSYQTLSVVWMQNVAITGMARWAAHPRHTTSTLATALEKLRVRSTLLPDPRSPLAVDHLVFSNQLASASTDVGRNLLKSLCPWERARAQRLLDYQAIVDLDEVALFVAPAPGLNLSEELRKRTHRLADYLYGPGHDTFLDRWQRTTPLLSGFVDTSFLGQLVAHRLDTQARLHALGLTIALTAYKQEHGHYPARLDELPDPIYQAFANDPWTGRPLDYRPVGFRADVVHPYFKLAAKRPVLQSCGMRGLPLEQPGSVIVLNQPWPFVLFAAGWSDSSAVAAGHAALIFPLP